MRAGLPRALAVAAIVVFWLASLVWLVFYEAYPGLLDRSARGYRDILSRGVMVMDQWMKISFQGRTVGYSHTSVGADDDADRRYRITNITVLNLNVMGSRRRISVRAEAIVDETYRMRTFAFTLSTEGYSVEVRGGHKHGDVYAVSLRGAAAARQMEVTIPKDALIYSPMTEMMLKSLSPGQSVTLRVFDPVSLSGRSILVRALREESIVHRQKPVRTTVLSATVDGMDTLSWIDRDGRVLRQETMFGWTMEACDAKDALSRPASTGALDADLLTSLAVPVTGPAGRLATARAAIVRLSGAPLAATSLASQRQTLLSRTGDGIDLRIEAQPPPPDAPLPVAETSTAFAAWVAATPFVQSDDPRIVEKARQITAGSPHRQAAAMAIYQWVHDHVEKTPAVSLPSAADVLLRLEGDCNEHTYLFVGLARAIGIPARIRVGLTLHNGLFYYHAWPSVYLGRWVDMDPTLGQPSVGPDHISLFEGELAEQMKLMGVIGRLKADVISVE